MWVAPPSPKVLATTTRLQQVTNREPTGTRQKDPEQARTQGYLQIRLPNVPDIPTPRSGKSPTRSPADAAALRLSQLRHNYDDRSHPSDGAPRHSDELHWQPAKRHSRSAKGRSILRDHLTFLPVLGNCEVSGTLTASKGDCHEITINGFRNNRPSANNPAIGTDGRRLPRWWRIEPSVPLAQRGDQCLAADRRARLWQLA